MFLLTQCVQSQIDDRNGSLVVNRRIMIKWTASPNLDDVHDNGAAPLDVHQIIGYLVEAVTIVGGIDSQHTGCKVQISCDLHPCQIRVRVKAHVFIALNDHQCVRL